ncbi:MAG: diguanylate cyclase [Solirubrobacteraceae bacterium]|nr:diguanylate cyclase [Solirubrobacteraceae bacterium]
MLRSLGFALGYMAMVWLGRASRLDGSQVALAWPAAGVAVLWLTASWRRPAWLAVDLALLTALTFAGNAVTGAPLPLAVSFSAANVVQAAVTCAVLAQLPGSIAGQRGLQGLARLIVAAVLGTCVGATVGPALQSLISDAPWPVSGAVWVFRNAVSTFLIVSAGVLLFESRPGLAPAVTGRAAAGVLLVVVAVLDAAIFSGTAGAPLAFAVVPAGVLVGLRCSVRVATVHALITWAVVAVCTYLGRGPFVEHTADERVMLVQALVAIVAFLTLALAIGRQEEQTLQGRLGEELGFVAALVDQLSTDLYICDETGQLHDFDAARQALVPIREGLAPEDWPQAFGLQTPDGARPLEAEEIPLYRALHGERVEETPMLMLGADGEPHHLMVTAAPLFDGHGRQRGAVARARDVTELRAAETQSRQRAEDLENVAAIAHRLASETDLESARQTICDGAARSAGASAVMLFELDDSGDQLACTASHGVDDAEGLAVPLNGQMSGTVTAFTSGRPFFVSDTSDHPAVHRQLIVRTGAVSAVFHPVVNDGKTTAVLAVGWSEPIDVLPARVTELLSLLSADAAMAIDRAQLIAELDSVARTDPLTGAHNRRALDARLLDDLARASRSNLPLCAVMIDLDHFKRYNDTRGHQQGDRLLKEAVARWTSEVRATDTLARYGGEEFAVVLPECSIVDAQRLAQRLGTLMPDGQTCSIGVAQSAPGESANDLLQRADAALYRAKAAGRDRVEIAPTPEPTAVPDGNFSQVMLRAARQLLGMDLAFLAQVDDGHLVFRDLDGDVDGLELSAGQAIDLDASYCQFVIDGRSDGRIPDTASDPNAVRIPATADGAVGAYIGAPIVLDDGRVVGTLCGMRSSAVPSLSDDQLELVRGLAGSMAAFITRKAGPDPSETDLEDAWQQATTTIHAA